MRKLLLMLSLLLFSTNVLAKIARPIVFLDISDTNDTENNIFIIGESDSKEGLIIGIRDKKTEKITDMFDYKDNNLIKGRHIKNKVETLYTDEELQKIEPLIVKYANIGNGRIKGQELYDNADKGDFEKVKELISEGANVNFICDKYCSGWTPVMIASANNYPNIVQYLIEKKADVNIENDMGRTALHFATNYAYIDIIKMLLDAGADPNAKSKDTTAPKTPVEAAIYNENTTILKLLLQKGGDKETNYNGITPKLLAEKYKDTQLKLLLEK